MRDKDFGRALGRTAPSAPASTQALKAIVRRSGRRRSATVGLILATGLIAGGLVGRATLAPSDDPASTSTAAAGLAEFEELQLAALAGDTATNTTPSGEQAGSNNPAGGSGTPPADSGAGNDKAKRPRQLPRPFDRLFLRTTANGIAIRAYTQKPPTPGECPSGQTCPAQPAAECVPTTLLRAELSNEGAIGPMHMSAVFAAATAKELKTLHVGLFGARERSAAQWVAVSVGPEVASVRARFSDGSSDEMAVSGGFVVLAHGITLPDPPTAGSTTPVEKPRLGGTLEGLDFSGGVVATQVFAPGANPTGRPDTCPRRPKGQRPGEGGPGEGGPRQDRGGPGQRQEPHGKGRAAQ